MALRRSANKDTDLQPFTTQTTARTASRTWTLTRRQTTVGAVSSGLAGWYDHPLLGHALTQTRSWTRVGWCRHGPLQATRVAVAPLRVLPWGRQHDQGQHHVHHCRHCDCRYHCGGCAVHEAVLASAPTHRRRPRSRRRSHLQRAQGGVAEGHHLLLRPPPPPPTLEVPWLDFPTSLRDDAVTSASAISK